MRNPINRLPLSHRTRVVLDWILTIAGAVAIVLAIKAWAINPYRIPSSSMEPTLHCARPGLGCVARFSDRVLANRLIYHFRDPERGEIVVFDTPQKARDHCGAGGVFVKRVIGLPGETWEERDGHVYIDGKRLAEPYLEPEQRDVGGTYAKRRIRPGHYFMMGDNRQSSCDSRVWGTVPREMLIGEVFFTYWPPNRLAFE